MNFNEKYILENDRVLLRPLEEDDFQNLLPFSLNEPEIWQYSLIRADGKDNLQNYIALARKARNEEREYPFIVFDKLKNQYAGVTRLYDIQPKNKTLQIGYTWYGKDFQGTGLNKHCKYLLLEFAFEKLDVKRIEFRADAQNQRSIQAMKSLGCTEEGILRSHTVKPNGERRDTIVLSILQQEWFDTIKQKLREKLI